LVEIVYWPAVQIVIVADGRRQLLWFAASDGGVAGAADYRGVSVGDGTDSSGARQ